MSEQRHDVMTVIENARHEALTYFELAIEFVEGGEPEELEAALAARPLVRNRIRNLLDGVPRGEAVARRREISREIEDLERRLVGAVERRLESVRDELGGLNARRRKVGHYQT